MFVRSPLLNSLETDTSLVLPVQQDDLLAIQTVYQKIRVTNIGDPVALPYHC